MCVLLSPLFSLDSSGRSGEDGGMRLPVGARGSGAAGEPEGGVSFILRRQTGTLAGETWWEALLSKLQKHLNFFFLYTTITGFKFLLSLCTWMFDVCFCLFIRLQSCSCSTVPTLTSATSRAGPYSWWLPARGTWAPSSFCFLKVSYNDSHQESHSTRNYRASRTHQLDFLDW